MTAYLHEKAEHMAEKQGNRTPNTPEDLGAGPNEGKIRCARDASKSLKYSQEVSSLYEEPDREDACTVNEAVQPTEQLLAEVSVLTGMPFPNLLYRELARNPSHLAECWLRVRDGLKLVGAPRLRRRIAEGRATSAQAPVTAHMTAAHPVIPRPLNPASRQVLRNVVDVYNTGNSCNSVLVMLLLKGAPGRTPSPLLEEPAPHEAAGPELPPLLVLDDMPEQARRQVLHLAQVVDPRSEVIPSVFRHLADDAPLMDAVHATLTAASDDRHLSRVHEEILQRIRQTAAEWPVPVEPIKDEAIRLVIEPFSRVIPRMLAVCAVLGGIGAGEDH